MIRVQNYSKIFKFTNSFKNYILNYILCTLCTENIDFIKSYRKNCTFVSTSTDLMFAGAFFFLDIMPSFREKNLCINTLNRAAAITAHGVLRIYQSTAEREAKRTPRAC